MILIGVPASDTIKTRTAFSLFHLADTDVALVMQMGCDVVENRNKLAHIALEEGYSHILFVDSDMTFNPDTLTKMLAHDKDILGLAANHRRFPLQSVVKPLNEEDINKPLPTELFEAQSCGTGVMLIKTEVFKNLPEPWFKFTYENGERIGEDVNFCLSAREAGYKIYVDPTIPVRHIGEYLY